MIGKLICHGPNRDIAIKRMQNALQELIIDGIDTNISLHQTVLEYNPFVDGKHTIHSLRK